MDALSSSRAKRHLGGTSPRAAQAVFSTTKKRHAHTLPTSQLVSCCHSLERNAMTRVMALSVCATLWLVTFAMFFNPQKVNSAAQPTGASPAQKFAELSDQFMKDSLALSPSSASQAGYHKHVDPKTGKTIELDALLDDMSLEAMAEQRAFYQQWRERFRNESPVSALDPQDAADWQLIDDKIGLNLLEFDKIQNYRHNPTVPVELIGNALFLPLTQDYAPLDVRVGHVLSRVSAIPRLLTQVKKYLGDSDPIFITTAIQENDGNIDLIENTIASEIPAGSPLKAECDKVAPPALAALKDFSKWLQDDLAKRPSHMTWRLGKESYDQKFRLVMETDVTPEQVLADAEEGLRSVRAEMPELAFPMHKQMYPDHTDHSELSVHERQNLIITEVLRKISDEHPQPGQLQQTIQAELDGIKKFIREIQI